MVLAKLGLSCFYGVQYISSVVEFDEEWGMDLIGILPHVVAFRIPLPFDEIL
jgi:hypothetical protein